MLTLFAVTTGKIYKMLVISEVLPGAILKQEVITGKTSTVGRPFSGDDHWISWNQADPSKPGSERVNMPRERWLRTEVGDPVDLLFLEEDGTPFLRNGIFASSGNFAFDFLLLVLEILGIRYCLRFYRNKELWETVEGSDDAHEYFAVSDKKLIIMSFATMGLYTLYWFYKNWKKINDLNSRKILPFWRSLLSYLISYSFFSYFSKISPQKKASFSPLLLAFLYFFFSSSARLPDPFWMISAFSFLAILPVNKMIRGMHIKNGTEAAIDSILTGWNYVFIALFTVGFLASFLNFS